MSQDLQWNKIQCIPIVYEEGQNCMLELFSLSPDGATEVHSRPINVRLFAEN
jgi:hypothetical protein